MTTENQTQLLTGKERLIEIPGFTIAAKEWGASNGAPVIALHGWLDNAASFDFLAPLLPDLHIIAMDTPGCGLSSHRAVGALPSLTDEIIYVLQVANALGWKQFHLLGHSRGGALAQLIAAGCPERVLSITLIDIVGFYTSPAENAVSHLRTYLKNFFSEQRPASLFADLDAAAKGRMVAGTIAYESALALTKRGTKEVEGGVIWSFDRREINLGSMLRYSEEHLNIILTGIETPTCIVLAKDGILKDRKLIDARAALIKKAELHFVEGHHHVHMDDPKVVAPHIVEFMKKVC